ncbi:MAG: PAS domain S-box protein [Candidatus Thorarchaeota archaeon]|nr:PAS domain S-box protein [Candidatus Thorarchaeota archaeon]
MKQDRARFREIAENMPLAVLEFGVGFTLSYANRKALDLLQFDESDLEKEIPVYDLVAPEQADLVREGLKQLAKGQEPTSISLRIVRKDSAQIPAQVYTERILSNGTLEGFLVYLVDLSRRAAIEDKMHERRSLLEFTVEHSGFTGIMIIDNQFTVEYVNDKLCDIVGRRRSELLGQDFRQFLHHESAVLVAERYKLRQAGKKVPPSYEFKILLPDDSARDLAVYASTLIAEDGSMKSVAQLMDVTEEKAQRHQLEESERRWRTLVETMTAGLGLDDETGHITYANKALYDMVEYEEQELVGLPSHKIISGITDEQQEHRLAARKAGEIEHYEANLVTKSGKLIPTMVSATPIFGPNGRYMGSFGIFSDVSDLKTAENEVRFLLDLLLHDIGNQLQLILAGGDLICDGCDSEEIQKAKQYVLDGAVRSIELISKVRRAEEAKSEPLGPVDLIEVLQHEIENIAKQYEVNMELHRIPESMLVYADSALSQLLWNIMENGVKHNPRKVKTLWIAGHDLGDRFLLAFADDGPGLNHSKKERLFDAGRRFGGVGLHLVRRLAEKYGANLKVQDRIEGHPETGLKVSVEFRVAKPESAE